jgi:hypothetical protein
MSRTVSRLQNPVVGDTIDLKLVTYNSNNLSDVSSIEKVEIYRLDPTLCSDTNKDGRYLVATIEDITTESTGQYSIDLETSAPLYTIGKYIDVWYVTFIEGEVQSQIENKFEIYPDLWYTSTLPAVYGFSFEFQPNRIRKGSVKWLIIKITPNVPRATEIERYYTNLAISSNLTITMELNCSPCGPNDCNLIIDEDTVEVRDKVFGYYLLDTSEDGLDLECGLYDITLTLRYADSVEISPKMQVLIY